MRTLCISYYISFFLFCNLAYSQNNSKSPQLGLNDGLLDYNNFPAISKNGRYIALIRVEYSCCVETDIVFEIHDTKTKKLAVSLLLHASPELGNFKWFSKSKQKQNIIRANRFLNRREYIPMKFIKNFEQKRSENSSKTQLEITFNDTILKSQTFSLPVFGLPSFCCTGEYNSTSPCNPTGTINNLWLDEKKRYLLIESGVHHAANGCDSGPEFLIVWLFK